MLKKLVILYSLILTYYNMFHRYTTIYCKYSIYDEDELKVHILYVGNIDEWSYTLSRV
jgi:hypothetical protein